MSAAINRYTKHMLPSGIALFVFVLGQGPDSLLRGAAISPSSSQVSVIGREAPLLVKIAVGDDAYPGFSIRPPAPWNLASFGHVEAVIANEGASPLDISLRVDNAGNWQDNPWDAESITVPPGERRALRTVFGYSYGYRKGFALDPSKVTGLVVFAKKLATAQSFRIVSVTAGGQAHEHPPEGPDAMRIKPADGLLFPTKNGEAHVQGVASGSIKGAVTHGPQGAIITTARGSGDEGTFTARIEPPVGRWDLGNFTDVRIRVRNRGDAPVEVSAGLDSNGGATVPVASGPIAPGAMTEIDVPFGMPVDINNPASRNPLTSDAVKAIVVGLPHFSGGQNVQIESIRAVVETAKTLAWLGQRPPVPGDWVETLNDDFGGSSLNRSVWSDTGENYYDKVTHWSKADVIVNGGLARLRYEKRDGFQNDDPARNRTPYAAGYLDSYGHWTQRYGYFESRMKLPTAPGLWPAFWMMPDRGAAAGDHGARQDTARGGMEFDIMENLSRWGPYRYNIAMHWDGYAKEHQSIGIDRIYVRPDKDGYLTCGLLWLPGEAVYYCNGVEVLRWKSPRVSNVASTMMFTLPSGGWDNNDVDDARLPDEFIVDYVRVWQRRDLSATSPTDVKIRSRA